MTTSQAPSVNLLISSMASAAVVSTAPRPLMQARATQPSAALLAPVPDHAGLGQREPDEHADREHRDQRLGVPLATTSRIAATTASTTDAVPVHLPVGRSRNRCGRLLSLASRDASTGRPPNEVFAASASSTVVISWIA